MAEKEKTSAEEKVPRKKKKPLRKNKWFKRAIALVVVAGMVTGVVVHNNMKKAKEAQADATSKTSVVTRGDVTVKITGSGTVSAIDEYNIVPTVNGTIDACYYDEGDYVEKGAVLYKFDSDLADNAIKTAENAIKTSKNSVTSAQNNIDQAKTNVSNRADDIQKAQENISKLTIYANSTGKVSGLNLTVGNNASGQICSITDTSCRLVKIPMNSAQFNSVSVGETINLSVEKYMINTTGTVQRKYSAAGTGSDGSVVYDVEVLVDGSSELPEGTMVTASVNGTSTLAGGVYFPDPTTVIAEQQGKVQTVYVKNGDWVKKGDVIAQLESSDLKDALKTAQQNHNNAKTSLQEAQNSYQNAVTNLENAQSTLEDKRTSADDYTITAPISGVVLSRSYKAGDTVYGQNSTTLMVIADMSKMKFSINVDELDIASIALGQAVEVTSDALEGVELEGRITKITQMGTTQNGVTNYPVEVTIDEPGELMSGMNVSAEIIVAEAKDVVRVSTSAVNYFEGKYYVTVVGEVEGMGQMNGEAPQMPTGEAPKMNGEAPQMNGEAPQMNGEAPKTDGEEAASADKAKKGDSEKADASDDKAAMPVQSASSSASKEQRKNKDAGIKLSGEEKRVEVEVGISDDDYYEIKSGLTVGQVVNDEGSSSSSGFGFGMMGGMMGGGGGAPGGGPGGGGPGGGR